MTHQHSIGSTAVPEEVARTQSRLLERVAIVDVVRGLVMILMVLDHTREFFTAYPGDPLDPQHTTPWLFLSRWITHLCAPTFVFLAGASIFLQQQRKPPGEITRFLLIRGAWLITVELTLVHVVFNYNWQWNVQVLEVIWAIGASMIVMAPLIRLGLRGTLVVSILLISGHNAFDKLSPEALGRGWWVWQVLHVPGVLTKGTVDPQFTVVLAYPLLPWVGVMALGYAWGQMLRDPLRDQRAFLVRAGTSMLAAFAILRWLNLYGDPVPWTGQAIWWRTLASLLNVRKYPPSLLFLLATLGVMALVASGFSLLEARHRFVRLRRWLTVFGRVPLFFFLLHIAAIHLLALLVCAGTGGAWRWWITEFPNGGVLAGRPPGFGYGLGTIWCTWLGVVLLCYPACKWYGEVKARSRRLWTSYL